MLPRGGYDDLERLARAGLNAPDALLEPCPEGLDGVEFGGVRWKKPEGGADCLDGLADAVRVMGREIVQYDDVPDPEHGHEELGHESKEHLCTRRGLNHAEREHAGSGHGPEHRDDPTSVPRDLAHDRLATWRAAMAASHRDVDTRFVDEDQASFGLALLPPEEGFALGLDVWAVALRCDESLFFRVYPSRFTPLTAADRLTSKPITLLHLLASSS